MAEKRKRKPPVKCCVCGAKLEAGEREWLPLANNEEGGVCNKCLRTASAAN